MVFIGIEVMYDVYSKVLSNVTQNTFIRKCCMIILYINHY